MSRPVTPATGVIGHAAADSTPTSYTGQDNAHRNPEYLDTDEAGKHDASDVQRSNSQMSQSATYIPSRGGTLKKKASLHKTGSVKRSGSRKSSFTGSVRSMKLGDKEKHEPAEFNSAFYCPVPTTSSPTEILANRFQAWRRVLKDLISYFRDLHKSYETRSKTLYSASNVINNITMPSDFLNSGGIADAAEILRDFHKQAINESSKARDLENEIIMQLTGLRSDLSQKIKEIKSLSGDFKNSVHKEQEVTRRAVHAFQQALGTADRDTADTAGKGDPFLIKMGVERQLDRQIEEENYLHRAFLNLEASGRELESIVVGEIQKAYSVLAGILKRDADGNYDVAEKLREGPLAMARDHEWDAFTVNNSQMVDPRQPLRQVKNITYEGKDHPAAIEVKSGMLERKSKYLKNYTPGWYILSPTHLHEFKSADQIPFQQPVMSLFLPEQKLGSHSEPGSSSHKFMLKGRQTGSMHRGHTWIFRAETHDTMMAWFSDIRELTEKRGEARNEFVRRTHARSVSAGSVHRAASIASGDSQMDEDEADRIAFSGEQSVRGMSFAQGHDGAASTVASAPLGDDARSEAGWRPQRPQPGGRFPSDVNVTRGLQAPLSRSSGDSGDTNDREAIAAANTLPGTIVPVVATTNAYKQTYVDPQPASKDKEAGTAKKSAKSAIEHSTHEPARTTANTPGGYATARPVEPVALAETGYTSNAPTQGSTNPVSAYAFGDFRAGPHADVGSTAVEPAHNTANTGYTTTQSPAGTGYTAGEHARVNANPTGAEVAPDTQSQYHEWVDTAGAGLAGVGIGALGATAAERSHDRTKPYESAEEETSTGSRAIPNTGSSTSAPMTTTDRVSPSTFNRTVPENSFSSTPIIAANSAPKSSHVHDGNEPNRLTASIYQATTLPGSTNTTDTTTTRSVAETKTSQYSAPDVSLISGTDIRAPSGSDVQYSSAKVEPRPSNYMSSATPAPAYTNTSSVPSGPGPSYSSTKAEPVSSTYTTSGTATSAYNNTSSNTNATQSADSTTRPMPIHSKSVQTISDLHIPGEFPR